MIDSHTHLTDESFSADLPAVLDRAKEAGITRLAVMGQDLAENKLVLKAARQQPLFLPFLGLHPDRFADRLGETKSESEAGGEDGGRISPQECQDIYQLIRDSASEITGIGEVGLDYWVCQEESTRSAQKQAFEEMVKLSAELNLPLNVHSRSAGRHVIDLLVEMGAKRVLMHAFDGKASHALRGAQAGFLFSVPPSIVRSPQKQKMVRALPMEAIALETDSPVLGPEKGVRNEPANVALSVRSIAEIKGIEEAEVREITEKNTKRVFGLDEVVGDD